MAQQTKRKTKTGAATRSNARKSANGRTRSSTPKPKSGSARDAVSSAAKQLKTPLIAAGTGLAGVAAGAALTRRSKGRSGLHLPGRGATKSLGEAAKSIGVLAERTGKVAQQVRIVSEALSEGGASGRPKSAIEVVLEGLTSRRQSRAG
jgi:hypothetical protein